MNLRQLKRVHNRTMAYRLCGYVGFRTSDLSRQGAPTLISIQEPSASMSAESRECLRALVEDPVTYSVRRKKDGVVVAEGLTIEDAQGMIDKAKAAKKASLELVL